MKPVKQNNEEHEQENENENENENEKARLSEIDVIEYYNPTNPKKKIYNNCYKMIIVIFITIFILFIFFLLSLKSVEILYQEKENLKNINLKQNKDNNDNNDNNDYEIKNVSNSTYEYINKNLTKIDDIKNKDVPVKQKIIIEEFKNTTNMKKKIGLAFVYSTLQSNGIARFITLTSNLFMKTGKYDICFITGKTSHNEFKYDSRIKRYIGQQYNYSFIRNLHKTENIDFFILQNVLSESLINFYKSLGKKVIGMFHGVFMSPITLGTIGSYRRWINYDLFDSYIFIAPDDYYFYKKLGFKNEIYIPNLYTFEPSEI